MKLFSKMFQKLISIVSHETMTRKIILLILDLFLVIFICCAYFTLQARRLETSSDRFIVFDESYEVQCSVPPEELLWRVQSRLAEGELAVLNAAEFEAPEQGPVLVVQAGRRPARLQQLLASLADVQDIGSALLVVCHSYYDEAINDLVRQIDFCRVLDIFYPYSVQLFPRSFPGPDANRSSRAAAAAEHKQQWWWTANFIFNHYYWIAPFTGLVLFLQEDDYVAPDLLYVLRYAERALAFHPTAEVISLGRPSTGDLDYGLLTLAPWEPQFARGLAFNQSLWLKVQVTASNFCLYDSASWNYSLFNTFSSLPLGYVEMITSVAPRVLSTAKYASGRAGAAVARDILSRGDLFPARVRTRSRWTPGERAPPPTPPPTDAGGWADSRDRLLCLDPFLMTTPPPLINETAQTLQVKLPSTHDINQFISS